MSFRALFASVIVTVLSPVFSFGEILINEVNINPPGIDGNFEYIEFISTTGGVESGNGLTLLVVDSNNGGYGLIRERWQLAGLSTGSNGLLLIGNNYPAAFPFGAPPPSTPMGDPSTLDGMGDGDVGSNDGITILLVRGFNPLVGQDYDLDPEDDGTMQTNHWTQLVDSIGFDDDDPLDPPNRMTYAPADVTALAVDGSMQTFDPDNVSRTVGDLRANTAAAWFGGEYPAGATEPGTVLFDPDKQFNGFPGAAATPGTPNQSLVLADLRINEVNVNPTGLDEDFEYIEITSVSGAAEQTEGHHLLVVESREVAERGTVREAWSLNGLSTGSNGLLLLGNDYTAPDPLRRPRTPFEGYPSVGTSASDIAGAVPMTTLGKDDIGSNEAFTLLLVRGYQPPAGNDLDTNNDGTFDVAPWTSLEDSVGFSQQGTNNTTYAPADVSQAFEPDNVSRVPGNMAANDASAWYGGDFGGESQFSIGFNDNAFSPGDAFRGHATPGRPNLSGAPAPGDIFINEVTINVPPDPGNDDDANFEFVELVSGTGGIDVMPGLTLLLVNGRPGDAQLGRVEQVIDVSGHSTGPNGLAVLGDSYVETQLFPLPFLTAREDPPGLNIRDISPNGGLAVLLVEGFTGVEGADLDTDNDGVFDVTPWTGVLDGVGTGAIVDPSVADVTPATFVPDNLSRIAGRTAPGDRTDPSAWYGGRIAGNSPTGKLFGPQVFGPFAGGVTRGYHNHAATPAGPGSVLINELTLNPPNNDSGIRAEFVEVIVSTLDRRSLSGMALVVVESAGNTAGGTAQVGEVLRVWDLSGLVTGDNGLLLLGDGYDLTVPYTIDPQTSAAAPLDMRAGDLEDNDAFSLLLVHEHDIGLRKGVDLDENVLPAQNNDGNFDQTPWGAIIDSVGFREFDADPLVMAHVGITYGGADLSQNFEPDTFARLGDPANLNPETAADWYGGDIIGASSTSLTYDAAQRFNTAGFIPTVTPGHHNLGGFIEDLLDNDKDGLRNLVEEAIDSDKDAPDNYLAPMVTVVEDSGQSYLALVYSRLKGGAGTDGVDYTAGGIRYTVEVSSGLDVWESGTDKVVLAMAPQDDGGATETVTIRLLDPLTTPEGRQYMRLRAVRQ